MNRQVYDYFDRYDPLSVDYEMFVNTKGELMPDVEVQYFRPNEFEVVKIVHTLKPIAVIKG